MLNVATESAASAPIPPIEPVDVTVIDTRYADYKIIRRNGAVVGFAPNKIAIAVTKAFIAVQGGQAAASARIRELVEVDHRPGDGGPAAAPAAMAAPSTSRTSRTRSNWR